MNYANLTDAELVLSVDNDPQAGARERVLVERLNAARAYICEIQEFLIVNNLAEFQTVTVQ